MSAFAFGGLPRRALRQVMQVAEIYVSPELLEEYREVPEELLVEEKITSAQWQALVVGSASVVATAKVVSPQREVAICRDPEDDMVLACCLAGRADVLVTGDKDLLDIDFSALQRAGLGRLRILSPRAYLGAPS